MGAFAARRSLKNSASIRERMRKRGALMGTNQFQREFATETKLEDFMTEPSRGLVVDLEQVEGDLMILGVGGKMGPTLARLAKRAFEASNSDRRVIAVSRFSNSDHRQFLEEVGVETIACDLMDPGATNRLPDCPNIVYLVGMKFGTTGGEAKTWAINTIPPANVCRRFPDSRIVALSTGNVYPFTAVESGGPKETDPVDPVGEYAQSALARERVFQFFSEENDTRMAIVRLNYAIDLRYGVLVDLAEKILHGNPIDLSMGYVNIIWQGDANDRILRMLARCSSPPEVLNLTGGETLSVRNLAIRLGERMGKPAIFSGEEADRALLSNAAKSVDWFGPPRVGVDSMIDWVADWLQSGHPTLGKPTHFETRDGRF